MPLIKKLTKIGNSYGVILPTEILKVVGLDPNGECELEVGKTGVLVRPHPKMDRADERVAKAMARFIKKYRHDLEKLS